MIRGAIMQSIFHSLKDIEPEWAEPELPSQADNDPSQVTPESSPSQPEPAEPSPRAMEWGCTDCERYDSGYCWLSTIRTWRNIGAMIACPGREEADVTHAFSAGSLPATSASLEDSLQLYRPERPLEVATKEFGCKTCDAHQRGWCGLAKFESWTNIRVLRACPVKAQNRS